METAEEKKANAEIYDLFRIGVLVKAGQGIIELIASVFVFFIPITAITRVADHFTEVELAKDPDDFIATHLADFIQNFSAGTKDFAALYLLLNGLIKLLLAIALLSGKRWAYPVALPILGAFILYLFYRLFLHHSAILAVALFFDLLIFYFIFNEYRIVRKKEAS